MPVIPDKEIIKKAIDGDRDAFRMLVERHQRFILSVSWRFVGNREEAEDITQETFVRLWKNLSKYRPEVKLTTWLYKITTNLCLDRIKSRRGRAEKRTDDVTEHTNLMATESADQQLINEEFRAAVNKLKDDLTPRQKAVFILRDLEEVPVADVCQILSMSAGNVKSNLFYARVKMSGLIEQYFKSKTEVI